MLNYVCIWLLCHTGYIEPKSSNSKNAKEPRPRNSRNNVEAKLDTDPFKEAWEHCKKSSKSIEVLYKNEDEDKKVLAKVHFRSYSSVSDTTCLKICKSRVQYKYFNRINYQTN